MDGWFQHIWLPSLVWISRSMVDSHPDHPVSKPQSSGSPGHGEKREPEKNTNTVEAPWWCEWGSMLACLLEDGGKHFQIIWDLKATLATYSVGRSWGWKSNCWSCLDNIASSRSWITLTQKNNWPRIAGECWRTSEEEEERMQHHGWLCSSPGLRNFYFCGYNVKSSTKGIGKGRGTSCNSWATVSSYQ